MKAVGILCALIINFGSYVNAQIPDLLNFGKGLLLKKVIDFPTPRIFVETLFNSSFGEVVETARNFKFSTVDHSNIRLLQYYHNDFYQEVDAESASVDFGQPIKVMVHGWESSANISWVKAVAHAYQSIGIRNTFVVDWQPLAKQNYLIAAAAAKEVGEYTADFLYDLIGRNPARLKDIHVVGHSLGAQCAGFIGNHILQLSGSKIGRITALDAAAPLFEFPIMLSSTWRISKEDADFVDAIHTNNGLLGFMSNFAHQDHHVNLGGPLQAGCIIPLNPLQSIKCSHRKATAIFQNSIISKNYRSTYCTGGVLLLAQQCRNNPKVILGEHNDRRDLEGEFHVQVTADNQPSEINLVRNVMEGLTNMG